jgi:Arc/MetJ-type ribon-helix-helix transcriptional regulator
MARRSQTNIRLPEKLKEEARIKALKEHKSLSTVIRDLLVEWLRNPPEREVEEAQKRESKAKQRSK